MHSPLRLMGSHRRSGANASFAVLPPCVCPRPPITGWLADTNVLFKVRVCVAPHPYRRPASLSRNRVSIGWLFGHDHKVMCTLQVGGTVRLGDQVEYVKGLSLMGGTPAFGLALLTFTEVAKGCASHHISSLPRLRKGARPTTYPIYRGCERVRVPPHIQFTEVAKGCASHHASSSFSIPAACCATPSP